MRVIAAIAGLLALAFPVAFAGAAEIKPAIVFDLGTKYDKSFNEGVFAGADRFTKETGIAVAEFEPTNETQFEQAHRRFAQRGYSPIVAVGFNQASVVERIAREFPGTRFTLIDGVTKGELPNVSSVTFREQEGSFLVGLLAAMASKTGLIGFVGGMDIPLIRKFACGYEQGARYAAPKTDVVQNMTGTTPSAWNDPTRGSELAKGQFDRGVDVVFAAAGATGLGVLQAASDAGKLAIGVDSNQNRLHPGAMLTSMVKGVDVAAYDSFKSAREDTWAPGVATLGLKEGGVGWSLDDDNRALITPAMKAKADEARQAIVAGTIKVIDYTVAKSCKG